MHTNIFEFVNITIIIFMSICHYLGLDRHVAASANSLFTVPPNRLRPFGLQLSITSGIL
jgi:hypothetical protein